MSSGAHHATIAGLVAKVRELEDENGFLDSQTDDLQDELADAFFLSGDETPQQVFTALRQELASWPRSDWRELRRLIASYVHEL
jgi:hypothetical protein